MKKQLCLIFLGFLVIFFIDSCKKQGANAPDPNAKIPDDVLSAIIKMGFNSNDVHAVTGGYIVEGDIFIAKESLGKTVNSPNIVIAKTEQYRTNNLVTGLPRMINISVTGLTGNFITATDAAILRWNNLNLTVKFQRVSSGGNIDISGIYQLPSGGFVLLGKGGFPENGNPYGTVVLNTYVYNATSDVNYLTSVIQHELGHCIGLRHTDYFNRSFSCGPNNSNVEPSNYNSSDPQNYPGAINIPGTPTAEDAGSLMLACNNGVDRSFNPNDIVALNYLYGQPIVVPTVNINGKLSFDWVDNGSNPIVNGSGTGSGTIKAPAGSTVAVTISAYGPQITRTTFTMTGAQLSGPMGNNVTVQVGSTTQTFVMPASGQISWNGTFYRSTSSGTGHISVAAAAAVPPPAYPVINGVQSITWSQPASGSGTISAAAGTLVHITVTATGAGTTTYFTMHDAPLTGNPSGVIYMQNNTTTQTFTMPTSGSVNWDGTFSRTGTTGTGSVAVY